MKGHFFYFPRASNTRSKERRKERQDGDVLEHVEDDDSYIYPSRGTQKRHVSACAEEGSRIAWEELLVSGRVVYL